MIGTTISESKFRITIHSSQILSMAHYYKKLFFLLILLNIAIIHAENTEETLDKPTQTSHTEPPTEPNEVNPEEAPQIDSDNSEHANGSICGYCSYCKVGILMTGNIEGTRSLHIAWSPIFFYIRIIRVI